VQQSGGVAQLPKQFIEHTEPKCVTTIFLDTDQSAELDPGTPRRVLP
jgi:hypothetical protein